MKAFTLIELLIVVAIIGILVAIAVPNFLDAQVRSKVARIKSEMVTVRTALEIYMIDHGSYPPGPAPLFPPFGEVKTWLITTPIAYTNHVPLDIFNTEPDPDPAGGPFGITGKYLGYVSDPIVQEIWLLMSYGPDQDFDPVAPDEEAIHYDPSNGTVSNGDIYKVGNIP